MKTYKYKGHEINIHNDGSALVVVDGHVCNFFIEKCVENYIDNYTAEKNKNPWDSKTGYYCATCRHYVPTNDTIGRCRRNAPTLDGYPAVYATADFCGEHKIGTNPLKESYNSIKGGIK